MRPIKLSMTAFGPFIATETIDFEVFGERPLFLINGDTGSGKTTILDAICFALYGQTTGKEREAMQMRCDYADDNTTTSVEFTFDLGAQRYRIERIPEQTRAKKSGEGSTTQKPQGKLWQIDHAGVESVLVPEKVTEVTKKIERLTGLQADQFRQVMVLPQGQFRRLLMADSKDREQIFSQLFETGIYKKIEDKLKQQAATVEASVRALKSEQHGVLQTVSFDDIDDLQQAIIDMTPELEASAQQQKRMESKYLTACTALEVANALDKDFNQFTALNAEYRKLEQEAARVEEKEKRLSLVDQALKIKPLFTEKMRNEGELTKVLQEKTRARSRWQQATGRLQQTTLAVEQSAVLEKKTDQLKQRIELLNSYRQRASKVMLAEAALKKAEINHQTQVAAQGIQATQLEQLQAQIKQGEAEKKRLEQQLLQEVDVASSAQTLTQAVNVRQRYEALLVDKAKQEVQVANIQTRSQQATENKKQRDKEYKQLELSWHAGQAAILAKQLQQDQPCLVCGSVEHPAPAQATHDLPTDVQRERAQLALETANLELLKVHAEHSKLTSALEGIEPQLAELIMQLGELSTQSLVELKQTQEEVSTQLQGLKLSRHQLATVEGQLDECKRAADTSAQALKQADQQFKHSLMQLQTCKAELASAQAELPNEYHQSGKLATDTAQAEAKLANISEEIERVQQAHIAAGNCYSIADASLNELKQRHTALQISAEMAEQQWLSALELSAFSTVEAFKQADLSVEEQDQLMLDVETFRKKRQMLTGAIQEREKSLAGKTPPDLAALQLALNQTFDAKNQADQAWRQIDQHFNRLQVAADAFTVLAGRLRDFDEEYKVIGTLSDVANGKVGNKISLQRFVLGVLLDDVLLSASTRLTCMSKGRYQLIRKEDRARGNKASGLEMEVEDTYTGKVRAVSTLSGGESFLASLALALGLSDVVQAYAGGIRLETLFIDEGFGSLDSDTLDLAIKTLIDLRSTGRMVGIISHVAELKEQINMRLDVIAGREGSRVELVY